MAHVEQKAPLLAGDWHDIPMYPHASQPHTYVAAIPLHEPGVFEAKAFFLPANDDTPIWPEGPNLRLKVEPALTVAANTIYTAFVRQFGPNRTRQEEPPVPPETLQLLEDNDWTVIPESGTFRELAAQLDHIVHTLGFRIIQLLPIHPVPTTFARMGRFGSPFASMDFFDVDPALAEFDRTSTPLDQFHELVDGIHRRQALLFLDLPINHTGWASHLQVHHPDWFARTADNAFASPGAWGVTWEDLSELDYRHTDLWIYMADVFRFWCERGVDGFRCDAGYMIPLPVWTYIIAKVRASFPDTVFLLEGLGGALSTTQALLGEAGLDWAYSEIFQTYDRPGIEQQIRNDHTCARHVGPLVHFAETHDNNRLAATSCAYARMRTALAALTADAGAFGITNGVEWFATAKVDVHGAPPLNWNNADNQVAHIRNLTRVLLHPAFHQGTALQILPSDGAVLHLLRTSPSGTSLLVLINLDTDHPARAHWSTIDAPFSPDAPPLDLLSSETIHIDQHDGTCSCPLAPGQAYCLAAELAPAEQEQHPITLQRTRALAIKMAAHVAPNLHQPDPEAWAQRLIQDPATFCSDLTGIPDAAFMTCWQWPEDQSRILPLAASHILLIRCPHPFQAQLSSGTHNCMAGTTSLPAMQGHFACIFPDQTFPTHAHLQFRISVHLEEHTRHQEATIQRLAGDTTPTVTLQHDRESLRHGEPCALLTNERGAYSQVRLEWGRIESQYDCLLGCNLHPQVPVDRHILLTRCRVWLRHKGYSHEISIDSTRHVTVYPGNRVEWIFDAPAGMGHTVSLAIQLFWQSDTNGINLTFCRLPASADQPNPLPDTEPVTLIVRPDIEDRNCHTSTKAYQGPEHHWPASIQPEASGFCFTPGPHAALHMQGTDATFTHEPEWLYGLPHPTEADRGLDPNGDLFSPGFFSLSLLPDTTHFLCAATSPVSEPTPHPTQPGHTPPPHATPFADVLRLAMQDFIVKRDQSRTVIAGYPWFLDWGRDTLICLRGIIAAGWHETASDIIRQFASFEQHGTIPNMIRGNDDRDRDTSDAPLWLFTAAQDLCQLSGNDAWLQQDCGGRSLLDILRSIAHHYSTGTPNGIQMDPDSCLIYSPAHFTWMDTNYPAGTPRAGYPIEIQALWFAALQWLAQIDPGTPAWQQRAQRVQQSIRQYYTLPDNRGLSDCLHAAPGTTADDAIADNALRPNQLFALTLGAIQDRPLKQAILQQTARLLVPGAIRSLADQAVTPALPIHGPYGLLNNPDHPYQGQYRGNEDTRRKPAYHNGTAWTWPFPSYCEALAGLDPEHLTLIARELLESGCHLLNTGCIGHLPEILDGDAPHQQRGCWAQAWGATEFFRVHQSLNLVLSERAPACR